MPNANDTVGNRNVGQTAASKCFVPNAGNAIGDRDADQVVAIRECIVPNTNDVGANSDTGQGGVINKRVISDAGNRQVDAADKDPIGDGHRTTRASVSRDGDIGSIRRVSEIAILIGSGRGGYGQKQQCQQLHCPITTHAKTLTNRKPK